MQFCNTSKRCNDRSIAFCKMKHRLTKEYLSLFKRNRKYTLLHNSIVLTVVEFYQCYSFTVLNSKRLGTLIKVYGDINPTARRQLESTHDVTLQLSDSQRRNVIDLLILALHSCVARVLTPTYVIIILADEYRELIFEFLSVN